jgi:DNA-directed RNA polymerase subunit omega
MITVDTIENKFSFVLAAAKRARQLQAGAKPLVQSHWRKPTRVAIDEILAQAVLYESAQREGEEDESGSGKKGKRSK